jgi:hypothetical protein
MNKQIYVQSLTIHLCTKNAYRKLIAPNSKQKKCRFLRVPIRSRNLPSSKLVSISKLHKYYVCQVIRSLLSEKLLQSQNMAAHKTNLLPKRMVRDLA